MKKRILRYPVLWYYVLTIGISSLLLVPHLLLGTIFTPSFSMTQFGPAIAFFLYCLFSGSPDTFRGMIHRFNGRKLPLWGSLAVLATTVILIVCGTSLSFWGVPFTRWGGGVYFYVAECLALLMCCAGEEVGWRGFLLQQLCKSHSLFASSLIVGVLWGIWHLNFSDGPFGFILFTVSIILNSVFLAWFYTKSGGNLLVAVMEHFTFNLCSRLILWNRFGIKAYIVEIVLYGLADLIVLWVDRKLFFAHPQNLEAKDFDR